MTFQETRQATSAPIEQKISLSAPIADSRLSFGETRTDFHAKNTSRLSSPHISSWYLQPPPLNQRRTRFGNYSTPGRQESIAEDQAGFVFILLDQNRPVTRSIPT